MTLQERDDPFRADPAFEDGLAMRPPVPGTLSREELSAEHRGGQAPPHVTMAMLKTGRERFDVFCAPCHGTLADGDGPVARKMTLRQPPSLLAPREATHPVLGPVATRWGEPASGRWDSLPREPREYFDIITQGFGLMPSYGQELPPEERWAVVAYLRALAFSQRAPLAAAQGRAKDLLERKGTP
jgi:mono/diheme cytochrome c family protein